MKSLPSAPLPDKGLFAIFAMPLLLAILSLLGLLSALLGQGGIWYWLSWVTLSLPIILILIFIQKSRRSAIKQ